MSIPFLAACIIVRDEAAEIAGCLESLAGVVDEVHVHDTGSSDRTPQIASELGATVTHGGWTDDFAAARNEALVGWRALWVLSVDADQRYTGDPGRLRAFLEDSAAAVVEVEVDNAHDELPYTNTAAHLFRKDAVRWEGRVHERLVGAAPAVGEAPVVAGAPPVVAGAPPVVAGATPVAGSAPVAGAAPVVAGAPRAAIVLAHGGYVRPEVRTAKALRNAELARRTLGAAGHDRPLIARTMLDLGRSLIGAGRQQEAVDTLETLRELFPGTPEWLHGTDFLARLVLAAGLDDVCLTLVGQLRTAGASGPYCDWLAAQALAQLGDVAGATRLLAGVSAVIDTAGRRHDPRALEELRILLGTLELAARPV